MTKLLFTIGSYCFLILQNALAQQPGDLDLSFGNNGIITFGEASTRHDQARSLSIMSNGKIVVAGKVSGLSGQDNDIIVGQLLSTGQLDNTFGTNGLTITDLGGTSDIAQDIVDGGADVILIVGGSNQSGTFQAVLIQYDYSGIVDSDFGVSGSLFIDLGPNGSGLVSASPFDSGHFFAIGSANDDFAIAKFQATGELEAGFGNSGTTLIDLSPSDGGGRIVPQPDGRILFSGTKAELGGFSNGVIGRLDSDGMLDVSFNGSGWLDLALSNNIDLVSDLALLPNGDILCTGTVFDETTLDAEIYAAKILSNGTFDNSFGIDGVAKYDIDTGNDQSSSMILQPDGKIIIGGYVNDGNDDNFCLIRINQDGSLDASFGNNGIVITEISPANDRIASMVLQADGMLVVTGTARIGNNDDIAVARYHTGLNISVNEVDEIPLFSAFPNPAIDHLSISAKVKLQTIELIDALGRSVLSFAPNAGQLQIDIASLPNGIYLFRATDGKRVTSQRFVKE